MQTRPIVITSADQQRLRDLIDRTRQAGGLEPRQEQSLAELEKELGRAEVVSPTEVPPNVVTMNSLVRVCWVQNRRTADWTVVYPEDADMDEGRISVLEPLGTALLGYREGDEFDWDMPVGMRRYRVDRVLSQPEAAGDFDR